MTLPRRFFLVLAAFLIGGAIAGCDPGPASAPLPATTTEAAPTTTTRPLTTTTQAPATVAQPLVPDVPDPTTEAAPAQGAPTALCKDGSLSYSQHRSGTCSHHGGVATWL